MEWKDFLKNIARDHGVKEVETLVVALEELSADENDTLVNTKISHKLGVEEVTIKKRLTAIYSSFERTCPKLAPKKTRGKLEILRTCLWEQYRSQEKQPPQPESVGIPNNLNQCYSGTPNFVGRISDQAWLDQEIQKPSQQPVIVALAGMGGVGKTELAIQYARQNLNDYQGGVCWILAREYAIAPQIISFAITQFNLHIPDEFDLPQQLDFCWRRWREGNVLLVLDDVADYAQVKPYLPPDPRFKVLITTQWTMNSPVVSRSLGVLEKNEALELLRSPEFVGESRLGLEESMVERLCEWLGYLPLGLELVGRYLAKKQNLRLSEMLEQLEDKSLDARALLKPEAEMTAQRGVAAAFELSWAELEEDPRLLCCLLGIFALAPIPWELVERCLPDKDREDLEDCRDEELLRRSLLKRLGESYYQLHQLIREFFAIKLQQKREVDTANKLKQSFAETLTAEAKTIIYPLTQKFFRQISHTLPHLEIVANQLTYLLADDDKTYSAKGLAQIAQFQRHWQDAKKWYEKSLEISHTQLGENHLSTASSLSDLASLYYHLKKYNDARILAFQSLQIREKYFGVNNSETASSMQNLAIICEATKEYINSELRHLSALHIIRNISGEFHTDTATSMYNLAGLYVSTKRYREAGCLYMRSLHIRETQLVDDHPDIESSLHSLAIFYKLTKCYNKAEYYYLKSIEITKKIYGEYSQEMAERSNGLAEFYYLVELYDKAEYFYSQSIKIAKKTYDEYALEVFIFMNNLARFYHSIGRYSKAELLYIQILEILVKSLPEDHLYIQIARKSFFYLLQQALANGSAASLSNHPLTQHLLQQMRA